MKIGLGNKHCGVRECEEKVVGAFQELIDVPSFENPNAEILGSVVFWCEKHRSALEPRTYGKKGTRFSIPN